MRYSQRYVCPREVVWLNGAPGSGKGTNMPFIMKSRGLSRTVTMSQLLDGSAEIKVGRDGAGRGGPGWGGARRGGAGLGGWVGGLGG